MILFMRTPFAFLLLGWALFAGSCNEMQVEAPLRPFRQTGAGRSLDLWSARRLAADGSLSMDGWTRAFQERQSAVLRGGNPVSWESLGPHNIGGRTLCIAFHPDDPNTVYAGSASGGLWVTRSAGIGADAWDPVPTGHPVLGVSAILIHPEDPQRMWIGTGEMYSNGVVRPGTINRYTRGTYGIGILRSTDGGESWSPSLDWSYGDMRGVQELAFNPQDPNTIYAATSEGLYRTYDGGETWSMILQLPMTVDLYIHPVDTAVVLVTSGSFFTPQSGLYRSVNGGASFSKVTSGFPSDYSGKAMLAGAPSQPDRIYAYPANAENGLGLFLSTDKGASWTKVNQTDISLYQGWYSHHLDVSPTDPNLVLAGGIDVYRSPNAGGFLVQTGIWEAGAYGKVPAGGPEGPPYYVHADVHAIRFHPAKPGEAWIATDGGLFVTQDSGMNFEGRNGGYQTQQFYARFSSSHDDPDFAIGGLQDNATAIFEGDKEWVRVLGGDGLSTEIDPANDERIIGSIQNLLLHRSLDRGLNFENVAPPLPFDEKRAFNGAVRIDPNQTSRVYAGGQRLYRSDAFAAPDSWTPLSEDPLDGDNIITAIEIDPNDGDHLVVVTSSDPVEHGPVNTGKVMVSSSGGEPGGWTAGQGLPSRYCTSVAFHPYLSDILLATFGGFGGPHLYRSVNGGLTWIPWGSGLPDVPVNAVVFDPYAPEQVYLGNDLGVWFSEDGGVSWSPYGQGLPEAAMVFDLSVSMAKKTLRAATHGSGVFEAPLFGQDVAVDEVRLRERPLIGRIYPNPCARELWMESTSGSGPFDLRLMDGKGRVVASRQTSGTEHWTLPVLPGGLYWLEVRSGQRRETHRLVISGQ